MHWRYLSNIQAFRYFAWIWCDFWWVLCHKTSIGEMYAGPTSIPYTKVTSIHYQTLSKNDTTWKIEVNNLSVWSLLGLLLFSWTSVVILVTIMKSFTTGVSRTFWWHAPPALCGWITGKGNLSRAEKIFYQENSVTWEDFLTTKVQLWIDTRSSIGNTLHGSGRAVEKVVYCFRSKKHLKKVVVILCATCLALKMQWRT